jgi:hypothetical protein
MYKLLKAMGAELLDPAREDGGRSLSDRLLGTAIQMGSIAPL